MYGFGKNPQDILLSKKKRKEKKKNKTMCSKEYINLFCSKGRTRNIQMYLLSKKDKL